MEDAADKGKPGGFALKQIYLVAIIAAIAVIIGVAYVATSGASAQTVAVGDNISVYYNGAFTNGTVFNSNVGGQPFNFTVGAGQVIAGFDNGVIGMKIGQNKTIILPPDEAYGVVNQSLIVQVPVSEFGNTAIQVGGTVTTNRGNKGLITALNATTATVDFNPPLAGQTLVFQIKVVSIKK